MRALIVVAALADVMPCGTHHRPPAPPPGVVDQGTPNSVVDGIVSAATSGRTEGLAQLCRGARDTWPPSWSGICAMTPEADGWGTFVTGWSEAHILDVKMDDASVKATVSLAFGKGGAERRVLTLTRSGTSWFVEDLK